MKPPICLAVGMPQISRRSVNHPLAKEFPELRDVLRRLEVGDAEFRALFGEYHELDRRRSGARAGCGPVGIWHVRGMTSIRREPLVLLGLWALALIVSGIAPHDRLTWWLEVAPVLIGAPVLIATYPRFPLSSLVYRLLFLHGLILILGAHYTYARVPVGFWIQDLLDLSRNPYDRIGHIAQGFAPAILAREILLRRSPLERGKWLFFLVTCVCLAISAVYELLEWWVAVIGDAAAESFLAMQGDVWDTQWDMFLALLGCLSAQLLLARIHDRSMARLEPRPR
jgi:putative membrane protein